MGGRGGEWRTRFFLQFVVCVVFLNDLAIFVFFCAWLFPRSVVPGEGNFCCWWQFGFPLHTSFLQPSCPLGDVAGDTLPHMKPRANSRIVHLGQGYSVQQLSFLLLSFVPFRKLNLTRLEP